MLLLRAIVLDLLVCFHVVGAAVLFKRLFPRESTWLALILPTLGVMCVCNFVEHFIALSSLGWLLPVTLGLFFFALASPGSWSGYGIKLSPLSWDELRLPLILFLVVFQWAFFLKCLYPEITNNTEGVADMARVLDFSLGDKLPPTDSWCPPYDHGGYYTFQHYGASLLKRLFSLDVGTGYNMGYTLLNTLTLVVGAGAAYAMGGRRAWVAVGVLLVLLANFPGSFLFVFLHNPIHPDTRLSIDIGDDWDNPARNNFFAWIFEPLRKQYPDPPYNPPVLRLFTPAFNTYFPEFHANLGGHFMTLTTILAANEANRKEPSNWGWILLLTLPLLTILTATWFFIVVTVFCGGCFLSLLLAGRRPESWTFTLIGVGFANMLIWPSVNTLLAGSYPVPFHWTAWRDYTPFWEFVIQWWPVLLPWFLLLFAWPWLSGLARGIHLLVPPLLLFIDAATFSDRGLTVEKMWGAVYGASLVTFLPLIFIQRNWVCRLVTVFYIFISVLFFMSWAKTDIYDPDIYTTIALHLKGDTVLQNNPQKKRMLQVLKRLHAQTVLAGRSAWSYSQAPSMVGFSENRCYIAWFAQEYQCGHGGEAEYRDQMSNEFYDGKMADPLPFLRSNDIAAILIYPEDDVKQCIPDAILQKLKTQLASDYYYIDCKMGAPNNAGVFLRLPGAVALPISAPPVVVPLPAPMPIPVK